MAGRPFFARLFDFARAMHHVVFDASRVGRAGEIAAWSNGVSALAVALGTIAHLWSRFGSNAAWLGLLAGALTLLVLRLALAHRYTLWLAALVGTLTIASLGAGVAWLFGHVVESPSAPSIAAVLGALLGALAPAWAYGELAKRRARSERDSFIDPISVPGSR